MQSTLESDRDHAPPSPAGRPSERRSSVLAPENPRTDSGLAHEWRRQRLLAHPAPTHGTPPASVPEHRPDTVTDRDLEQSLLADATAADAPRLERAVFDRSRSFGLRLAHRRGRPLRTDELVALLQGADVPCLTGLWERLGSSAWTLRRPGCDAACSRHCDYWREAIDGLVMGAGDDARYARHRSRDHGDLECLDLLYDADEDALRWGPVPDEVSRTLAPVTALLARSGVTLHLDGLSEGVLFYRLASSGAAPCGPGGTLLKSLLEREVGTRLPGLRLLDVTPIGVLKEV